MSSVSSSRYRVFFDEEIEIETGRDKDFEGDKGSSFMVQFKFRRHFFKQARKENGERVKLGDDECTRSTVHHILVTPSNLDDLQNSKRTLVESLINPEFKFRDKLDVKSSEYFVESVIPLVERLADKNKDKDFKLYLVTGSLHLITEEILEEKEVLGLLKTERIKRKHPFGDDVDDGNKDECSICMMEISVGNECLRTPCSHVYHYECIFLWLTRKTTCPYCRRIVR